MKTATHPFAKFSSFMMKKGLLALFFLAYFQGHTQNLTPEFVTAGYTLTDLGSIDLLPSQYGGLTIRPEQPNTLYIGGSANTSGGGLYTVALTRDPESKHITGFGGSAVLYTEAPNNDGGIFFAQNGTLLFTRYSMNELGQVLPNNSYIGTPLTAYGVASSVGALAFVPAGYPGAGGLVFSSYSASIMYNVPYTIDISGQYLLSNQIAEVDISDVASGPEGIAYIPAGSAAFPNLSMAISSYGNGTVVVFEVGDYGLPVPSSSREMVTGLTGAEGALIDPLTGDFLFSTFGGGNKVIRISGFTKPSSVNEKPLSNTAGFSLFPNPTEGYFKLDLVNPVTSGLISVFNIHGAKVLEQEIVVGGSDEYDLSAQPAGLYFVRIKSGNSIGYQRLILK
ncbi:MAG: T9SS type A sorting domain-containing protein [Lentimicrobium sp.]|nr:T9SS type A sorting domain-containing protein [Lentimicrobium sp.]